MAQAVPTLMFHGQALKIIGDLRDAYTSGVGSIDEIISQLHDAMRTFESSVGTPLLDFEPVVEGEPPLTTKINRLWDALMHDINILSQQADVDRATAIFTHNMLATEILAAQAANSRVANKLKTLQLYSKAVDSSIVTFGDYFRNTDFIDFNFSSSAPPMFMGESYVVLGQDGGLQQLGLDAAISILPTSNGFLGNLHEVTGETRSVSTTLTGVTPTYEYVPVDPTSDNPLGGYQYVNAGTSLTYDEPVFKAETDPHADLTTVLDGLPNTWIEYEHCLVADADRKHAGNFNFSYEQQVREATDTDRGVELVDWADGPENGVLKLDFEFDLGSPKNINYVTLLPYNLDDNKNYAIKVSQVQTSVDKTSWDPVHPRDVLVGSTTNLQSASAADANVTSNAIWAFSGRTARFVQISIEQSHPVQCQIGHLYYLQESIQTTSTQTGEASLVEKLVEGPNPSLTNPTQYYDPAIRRVGGSGVTTIQRREVFSGQRWVVGIRDITIQQVDHALTSTLITKPLRVGGVVDRVVLDADITIPPEFPTTDQWISFFVSPDEGANWFPIARVQDDYLGIPEEIAFNDPLPADLQEPGVGYYTVGTVVTSLRLKVVMKRPGNTPSGTPVLHSYTLKVKQR